MLAAACNLPGWQKTPSRVTQPPRTRQLEAYPIDSLFSEFYYSLGGADTLGPVISPLIEFGNIKIQYVEAGLLEYDPLKTASDQFSLAPVGVMLGVAEPPVPDPGKPDERYINGHVIYPPFLSMYEKMGRSRFVGRPLTEVHHDPEKRRITQYFENLGFYQLEDDPTGKVSLLAYGAFICDLACRYQPPDASIPSLTPYLPEPYSSTVVQLGLDFVGLTLTSPYPTKDGKMEVIFKNVVMVVDTEKAGEKSANDFSFRMWLPDVVLNYSQSLPGDELDLSERTWLPLIITIRPGDHRPVEVRVIPQAWIPLAMKSGELSFKAVSLRPIVALVGIQAQPPVDRRDDPLLIFYKVQGDKGYHVPIYFNTYLQQFGGIEMVGLPITEVFQLKDGIYRQCFTNLCLDFDVNAPDSKKLSVAPLGLEYMERYYPTRDAGGQSNPSGNISIRVNEGAQYIAPDTGQGITIIVTEDGVPLINREPVLSLTMPDNQLQEFTLEPTDEQGKTSIELPPIAAPNGTIIKYKVCLDEVDGEPICESDNYLIWEYP